MKARIWPKNSIVWYCGKSWESWSPKSFNKGLAGSETAVIYLSKEWARLGYKVTVYNTCKGEEGIYDNVKYVNFDKFNLNDRFDTLIIWRDFNLDILDSPIKANRIWLELQDIPYRRKRYSKERTNKIDRIFIKSKFHGSFFFKIPNYFSYYVPKTKFVIIPNGIDKGILGLTNKKYPFKLIYASNYTRGLELMLKHGWPIIKKKIPAAELHAYYGWGHFDAYEKNPDKQKWKKEMINLMEKLGVVDHGRISQNQLIEEKSKSAIHYYGCIWHETDCISVRESAAVGCVPVTTRHSALAEKPYCIKIRGNPYEKKTQQKIAYKIIKLLKNPRKIKRIGEKFRIRAAKETWDVIAERWLKELE